MSQKHNVLIIGAGVSGLTTALQLLKAGHSVTLWSKEGPDAHPHTSANAYAMWVPVVFDARLKQWSDEGKVALTALATDPSTGIVLREIVQLKAEGEPNVIKDAPVIDPPKYLDWLREQVIAAGGAIEKRTITNLDETPSTFDVVVNCAGLGARELASDAAVHADRVQVLTIKPNPKVTKVVIDDEGANKRSCVVPHADYIKLGAVFDGKHETLEVDDAHTQDILARCNRIVPELNARREDVLTVVRAIRPEREGWLPRVEKTTLADGRVLIHNYGHDGMGYILSHGIADEIAGYLAS